MIALDARLAERSLGVGALVGAVARHLPLLASVDIPPDVRSALLGALGAGATLIVSKAAGAIGDVLSAYGRRWARRIEGASKARRDASREGGTS